MTQLTTTSRPGRHVLGKRLGFVALFAALAGWLIFVTFSIATEDDGSEPSPQKLAEAVQRDLRKGDADALQKRFTDDTAGEKYADTFVGKLKDIPGDRIAVRAVRDALRVEVAGSPSCTAWTLVEEEKGHWKLDGTPPGPGSGC
ncbi:hypothetical protein [Streptomyces sp. I05A-00742]|uniref:hypothetical protein n=1 Tax=Streptomyces sp. I05A-00742 TaxID=2732853 RepID=UPI00148788DF|nr:hypothetical protein [Streptomyces sp. I05A-00742]